MAERRFIAKSLFMLAGLLIWAAHFTVMYAFNALACARGFAGSSVLGIGVVTLAAVLATAAAAAATAWMLFLAFRWEGPLSGESGDPAARTIRYAAVGLGGLGLVAILWSGLPALIVPPCG